MAKIFVRSRRHVGRGAGRPRFAIVAVEGVDLKIYRSRIRKSELETIAAQVGAELVYLPRGEQAGGAEDSGAEDSAEETGGKKTGKHDGRGRKHRKMRANQDEE
jgi:hypothetical protein